MVDMSLHTPALIGSFALAERRFPVREEALA
jgi:hypothetical protein